MATNNKTASGVPKPLPTDVIDVVDIQGIADKVEETIQSIDDLGSLARNGSLADGSNLNNVEFGIWALFSSRTYTNMPSGLTTGVLFAMPTDSGAFLAQIFIGATGIRTRIRTGALPGTWTNWI